MGINRRAFLKAIGALGVVLALPFGAAIRVPAAAVCIAIGFVPTQPGKTWFWLEDKDGNPSSPVYAAGSEAVANLPDVSVDLSQGLIIQAADVPNCPEELSMYQGILSKVTLPVEAE